MGIVGFVIMNYNETNEDSLVSLCMYNEMNGNHCFRCNQLQRNQRKSLFRGINDNEPEMTQRYFVGFAGFVDFVFLLIIFVVPAVLIQGPARIS